MKFFASKPSSFASAERTETPVIKDESSALKHNLGQCSVLDMLPDPIVILNANRQILFANRSLLCLLKMPDDSAILGLRPGELLDCAHADNDSGGCGTTQFCRLCGAVNSIVRTQQFHIAASEECQVITSADNAYNFRVWTSPFLKAGINYTLMVIRDIADEVYRHSLERIFFHDIINIASGLHGLLSLVKDEPQTFGENYKLLVGLTEELLEEINSQRDLLAAESGSMCAKFCRVRSTGVMEFVGGMLSGQQVAAEKKIVLDGSSENVEFKTDPCLLKRIIINLAKNALEASSPGGTVTLKASISGGKVVFEIHNDGCIAPDVQLRIFNRAFSTKGNGRGLGAYSTKLLGEKYLHGKVSFTSSEEKGTSFFVELPLDPVSPPAPGAGEL